MLSTVSEFDVRRSPADTFAFVADGFFTNQPKWALTTLTRNETGPVAFGTSGTEDRPLPMGRRRKSRLRVTKFDRPRRFAYETVASGGTGRAQFDFVPTASGTHVTHRVELELHGFTRLLSIFIARALARTASDDMRRLQDLLT